LYTGKACSFFSSGAEEVHKNYRVKVEREVSI
jgi:hypothetical protein